MSDPKCATCQGNMFSVCVAKQNDHTGLMPVRRVIVLRGATPGMSPVHYVWRFYCQGREYRPVGGLS